MQVTFFQRLGAYIIDIIIIGIISSIVCIGLPTKESTVEEEISKLSEKYTSKEITTTEFYSSYSKLLYQEQKDNMLETGISLVLTIGYFIVFQYLNKGQTIGKKLLKIRVVNNDDQKPAKMLAGIIRSIITLGIASSVLSLILLNIFNKKTYVPCYMVISAIETIFIIITVIFIVFRKDGRGLHDIMAKTTVVKEEGR